MTTTRRRTARALTVFGAVLATLAVWAIAVPLVGADLIVNSGTSRTHVEPVSALAGLTGWALLALLQRWSARPIAIWTGIAVAVLVLSLLGPLGGVTVAAKLALAAMHLAAAAVLILGLRRTAST